MENSNTIQEELNEIAPSIAVLDKTIPYQFPISYFDFLPGEILRKINSANTQNPYQIPVGYFDGLAGSIFQKIHSGNTSHSKNEVYRELLEIAPLLNSLSKENIFTVPENYFEKLTILGLGEKHITKVVPLGSYVRKWVTYAAAASILFIVSTASYFYANKHIRGLDKSPSIEQRLADLNDDDIISYLNDNQETPSDYIPASATQETEIHQMLEKASDDDIKSFLDDYDESDKKTIKGI